MSLAATSLTVSREISASRRGRRRLARRALAIRRAAEDVHDAVAEGERTRELGAEPALVPLDDDDLGDGELDRVLAKALEPRPRLRRQHRAVDAERGVAFA